jgi:Bacterial transcriptional activator domain
MMADSKASRLRFGCDLAAPVIRVYLTGELCLEAGERVLHERLLPGPQGRHLLAFLAAEHVRAVGHDTETLLAHGDPADAVRAAFVTRPITARPVLPGHSGSWLEQCRRQLDDLRLRALECSARAHLARGDPGRAVRDVQLAVELAPLREPAWRCLPRRARYGPCRHACGQRSPRARP